MRRRAGGAASEAQPGGSLRPLTAQPLLLPPGMRPGAAGLGGVPKWQLCPEKS